MKEGKDERWNDKGKWKRRKEGKEGRKKELKKSESTQ